MKDRTFALDSNAGGLIQSNCCLLHCLPELLIEGILFDTGDYMVQK
jgi:hypothetical protein